MAKILVYDGDCPMCGWISRRSAALGLVDDARRRPFQEFEGARAEALEEAGIRNEMLVLDESSDEIRAGIAAFLWLLEDTRIGGLAKVLATAPLAAVLRLVYRTIAYNRRVLAPPPGGIVCRCDPDPHGGFRTLFLVAIALFDLGGAAVCGLALERALGVGGPLVAATSAVAAIVAQALVGRLVLPPIGLYRLAGNSLVVVAVGVGAALPAGILSLLTERTTAWLLVMIAGMLGAVFAVRSLWWRVARLAARPGQTAVIG